MCAERRGVTTPTLGAKGDAGAANVFEKLENEERSHAKSQGKMVMQFLCHTNNPSGVSPQARTRISSTEGWVKMLGMGVALNVTLDQTKRVKTARRKTQR